MLKPPGSCSARLAPDAHPCGEKPLYAYGWGGGGIDLCAAHSLDFEAQADRWIEGVELAPWRLVPNPMRDMLMENDP